MESKFTISEVLKTSWKCTKSQIWVLVGLFIGYTIISSILSIFGMPAQELSTGIIITNLVNLIISIIFILGYIKNLFQALDGEEPQFSAYGQQSRKFFTCLIASFIYSMITTLGLALLLIPGIYLAIRLQFFIAFIIEEDASIIDSLTRSWDITKGQVMPLFLLGLVMTAVTFLGLIVFIVGIFVAIPVTSMMYCYSFRKLNTINLQTTE